MPSSVSFSTLEASAPGLTVLTPSSPSYAERRKIRCQNRALEKVEPPAIAVPKSAEEVAAVVRWCVSNGVRFTVRGGGNDYFGRTVVEGALVIDMRDIAHVRVAADRQTATIGGGTVMKDLVEKLDAEGLVTPVANTWIVGYVGCACLGGYGPMQHSHGPGIAQVVGAEIVTASGEVVSFGEEDERLEGIRGLSGNLGVVTAVTIRVYPKFEILNGNLVYESSNIDETVRAYHAAVSKLTLPAPLTIHHFVMNLPALGGRHFVVFWTWASPDHEAGKKFLTDFLAATPAIKVNPVAAKSFPQHYASVPDFNAAHGGMRTQHFRSVTPGMIEAIVAAAEKMPDDPMCNIAWTGAVPIDPAVRHCLGVGREHVFFMSSYFAVKDENKTAVEEWNKRLLKAVREAAGKDGALLEAAHPGLTPLGERTLEEYLGKKTARARELKARYDPNNVFSIALPRFA